jgi:uncharacterized SAM-binding protein YcdF (DUF218 family)
MRIGRRLRWRMIVVTAGMLILAVAIGLWNLPWAARWLDIGDPPQPADAVVLLNGSLNSRPFVAAALVHGGWAANVLFSTVADGPNQISGAAPREADVNLKVLEYGGVPRERIIVLDCSVETTFDEARAVDRYLADRPVKRLLIVTEGPHTRRARWIFERVLAGRPVEIAMVSAPSFEFDSENWWRSEVGFMFVVSEYPKLFFYGLRYGWLGIEIVLAVAIISLAAWFLRRRQPVSVR